MRNTRRGKGQAMASAWPLPQASPHEREAAVELPPPLPLQPRAETPWLPTTPTSHSLAVHRTAIGTHLGVVAMAGASESVAVEVQRLL